MAPRAYSNPAQLPIDNFDLRLMESSVLVLATDVSKARRSGSMEIANNIGFTTQSGYVATMLRFPPNRQKLK